MTTEQIIINWQLSLSDSKFKKLLNSKLNAIQCYNIDMEEIQGNLHEQDWDIETYNDIFYNAACYRGHDGDDRKVDYDYHW